MKENGYSGVVTKDGKMNVRNVLFLWEEAEVNGWKKLCKDLEIPTKSNRVDIGVRVELPAVIFSHLTDELYESKIVYRTEKFEDKVRTFCMNPNGIVVNENTNGIVTVNGHSYEVLQKQTENTNFALLVANISQNRSKTATDTVKVLHDFPICLAVVLLYSVSVI